MLLRFVHISGEICGFAAKSNQFLFSSHLKNKNKKKHSMYLRKLKKFIKPKSFNGKFSWPIRLNQKWQNEFRTE